MKVEINTKQLTVALKNVLRALSKSTLPILSNVLIEALDTGTVRLTATDLEMTIAQEIEAAVAEPGATTTPAVTFCDLVGTLDADTTALSLGKGETLTVKAGSTRSRIKGISADNYPPIPASEPTASVLVETSRLREAVNLVAFAASKDDGRVPFNGVNISADGQTLTLAATDGYRLSEVSIPVDGKGNFRATIPARAAKLLPGTIGKDDDFISVQMANKRVAFDGYDVRLHSAVMEQPYPDVKAIIPTAHKTRVTANLLEFERAAKQAALFSQAVRFDVSEDALKISGQSKELGKTSITIGDASVEGASIVFGLQSAYVLGVLKAIGRTEANQVVLDLLAADKPVLMTFTGLPDFRHVIMPMYVE
jgi:DNA polymerase-3 subunit beta